MLDELLGALHARRFIPRAQDLVFYGKTGRGKTHLAIGLGMKAIDMGLGVRFHQTAELVLSSKAKTRRHARDAGCTRPNATARSRPSPT